MSQSLQEPGARPAHQVDLSDYLAVQSGIDAYEQRRFPHAFDLLYPVLNKFRPDLRHTIDREQKTQPARVVFTVLTQLADIFPAAQYRAAQSELLGYDGVQVCPTLGLERLTDAAQRGHRQAMAFLAECHVSRAKPTAYFWMTVTDTPRALAFRDAMMLGMTKADIERGEQMARAHVCAKSIDVAYQATFRQSGSLPIYEDTGLATQPIHAAGDPNALFAISSLNDLTVGKPSGRTRRRPSERPANVLSTGEVTRYDAQKLLKSLEVADARGDKTETRQLLSTASTDVLRAASRLRKSARKPV